MTQNEREIIAKDRMKYKNNALSSNLSILAIAFNAIFFITVFRINKMPMYTHLLGISVVFNLIFMLTVFFSSTKLKVYDMTFCYLLLVVAAIQIVRIFIIPPFVIENGVLDMEVPEDAEKHLMMIVWLLLSCLSLVAASVIGIVRTITRRNFIKAVEAKEIDISFISKQKEV